MMEAMPTVLRKVLPLALCASFLLPVTIFAAPAKGKFLVYVERTPKIKAKESTPIISMLLQVT